MSYVKPIKVCQDLILGFQTVATVITSLDTIRTKLFAKHGQSETGQWRTRLGAHNDWKTAAAVSISRWNIDPFATSGLNYLEFQKRDEPPRITGFQRIDTGIYMFTPAALHAGPVDSWAYARPPG